MRSLASRASSVGRAIRAACARSCGADGSTSPWPDRRRSAAGECAQIGADAAADPFTAWHHATLVPEDPRAGQRVLRRAEDRLSPAGIAYRSSARISVQACGRLHRAPDHRRTAAASSTVGVAGEADDSSRRAECRLPRIPASARPGCRRGDLGIVEDGHPKAYCFLRSSNWTSNSPPVTACGSSRWCARRPSRHAWPRCRPGRP